MATYEARPQSPARAAHAGSRADRILRSAALLLAACLLIHKADHARRGFDLLTTEVFWAGSLATALAVVAVALVFRGARWAPQFAVAAGFSLAIGLAAVHLVPGLGVFGDPLADGHADALSWAAVLIGIAGSAAFGAAGVYALRHGE